MRGAPRIAGALVLLAAAGLLALNLVTLSRGCGELGPVAGGAVAPRFELRSLSGRPVSLDAQRGKVVLVDFWAAWCAPCLRAMPLLARLQREHPAELRLLSVNVDGDEESARRVERETGGALTMLLDTDSELARRYGAQTLPHLVLIDRRGRVVRVLVGEVREPVLREALGAALRAR
jgi:thiol-disulfide isomerase/thioredoxin